MDFLPEDCVAHILSFATPVDACRMCLVSSIVQSIVESDSVWARFLPSDYHSIVSELDSSLECSSMKELFFKLCIPFLIDKGKKMFWLDKRTAKKCYILSARELSITWASNPIYCSWKPSTSSRFAEVAELKTNFWLEIQGSIAAPALSPKSTYEIFLIVRFANMSFALGILQTISVDKHNSQTHGIGSCKQPSLQYICYSKSTKVLLRSCCCGESSQNGRARKDGWIEIKLGEYYNDRYDQDDQEVLTNLIPVKGVYLSGELIVEGIEIRVKQ